MNGSTNDDRLMPPIGGVFLRAGVRRMVIAITGERVEFVTSRTPFGTTPGKAHKSRSVLLDAWRFWAAGAVTLKTGGS